MNREQLATRMQGVYTLLESLQEEEAKLKNLEARPLVELGKLNTGLLDADDFEKALQEEAIIARQVGIVESVRRRYEEALSKFESEIPARLRKLMVSQDHVLFASWTTQDAYRIKRGPYAASYCNGTLQIERFSSFEEMKAQFNK